MDITQVVIDSAANAISRALAKLPVHRAAEVYARYEKKKGVDAQAVVVPLIVTLPTSGGAYTATYDTFVSKSDHILLVREIRAIVALRAPTTETLTIANIGNIGIQDRVALKAGNARVTLKIPDQTFDLTEDAVSLPLSALPIVFPEGRELVLTPNQKVRMTVALTDTTASIYGGSTDYGIVLVGQYTHERILEK